MKKKFLQHSRTRQRSGTVFVVMLFSVFLTGCAGDVTAVPVLWQAEGTLSFTGGTVYSNQAAGLQPEIKYFTDSICVPTEEDLRMGAENTKISAGTAILFNLSENQVLFAKNCYNSIYPASTTKLLTALVTLKYGNLSDVVTIREDNGGITTYGAKLCGFKKGDQVTLETLLNSLMVYSGNDAAVAIAEHISGSTEAFMELMNAEAAAIGATHTNFVNPHGLHNTEHTTTAYDMYLIFRECLKYDAFLPIIGQTSYTALYTSEYMDAGENTREKVFESTNQYLLGNYAVPESVTVYGGKTGSTGSAGDCLILLSSCNGEYYISAVFGAASKEALYQQMTVLLELELSENIPN